MDNHQGYSIFSSTPSQTQELIMEDSKNSVRETRKMQSTSIRNNAGREAFVSLIGFHLVVRFPARA
ncbi:hypothetical protein JI435_439210 [Parastagonospora nodorum SN15]|uniref:Uncharacterized protein n=1 Tax=Phaeosphaeria nodorum (strain SN15 / ATCC MYA-4574 / FGSC 10173) TaxID=321614 RepID=A0A7U2FE52_PHANO|nr:hypothetical protein HBI73_167910 [Parastagonospora nodorum]QRD01300.1 hypothetical protein JI435_439210 [Parastagonospora nodorum SN15]KAH5199596.1 hypothetical protein HBH68_127040 [Parastagonospora nodorum]KAH5409592.1 hypothetical protein HBI32_136850 [Parastagonospora nodorum]KAH5510781.1 hypothetical protein HBI52_130150 [Parastagonospora nodorum]